MIQGQNKNNSEIARAPSEDSSVDNERTVIQEDIIQRAAAGSWPSSSWHAVTLTAVIFFGAGIAGTLFFVTQGERWEQIAIQAAFTSLWMIVVAFFALAILAPITLFLLRRFLGRLRGSVKAAILHGENFTYAAATGDRKRATEAGSLLLQEVVAWQSQSAVKTLLIGAGIGLITATGSVLGGILVLRQNTLIGAQNILLRDQTLVAEATRRNAALNPTLIDLLESIEGVKMPDIRPSHRGLRSIDGVGDCTSQLTPDEPSQVREEAIQLNTSLTRKIVAFTRMAEPYLYLRPRPENFRRRAELSVIAASNFFELGLYELGEMIDAARADQDYEPNRADPKFVHIPVERPLSPERGTLLRFLLSRQIDVRHLRMAGADFTRSDLLAFNQPGARLTNMVFAGSDLTGANLVLTDMSRSDFAGSDFSNAALSFSCMTRSFAWRANFTRAIFGFTDLSLTELQNANLSETIFYRSNLTEVKFKNSDLRGAYFAGSNITGADFTGATLQEAEFSGAWVHVARTASSGSSSPMPHHETPPLPTGLSNGETRNWRFRFRPRDDTQEFPDRFELQRMGAPDGEAWVDPMSEAQERRRSRIIPRP